MIKKIIYTQLWLLTLYVGFEALSGAGLLALKQTAGYDIRPFSLSPVQQEALEALLGGARKTWRRYDGVLGWAANENYTSPNFKNNSRGMRAFHDYGREPAEGTVRIAAFGDSYTEGAYVSNEEIWTQRLESAIPDLEVLNFGVSAYGLDQSYLAYRQKAADFNPAIVFLGFVPRTANRQTVVFYPFYHSRAIPPLTKPRFRLTKNGLILQTNPLPTLRDARRLKNDFEAVVKGLSKNDFYGPGHYFSGPLDVFPSVRLVKIVRAKLYRLSSSPKTAFGDSGYRPESEAFRITERIFDEFYRDCLAQNRLPLILLFPSRSDLTHGQKHGNHPYQFLAAKLRGKGYRVIDLFQAFQEALKVRTPDELFTGDGNHYSAFGHEIVSRRLEHDLSEQGLLNRGMIDRLAQEEKSRFA